MKWIRVLFSLILTVALLFFLNERWGQLPPLGKFLSPQQGFWENAESLHENFSDLLHQPYLEDSVAIYLDERLVPHIFAQNEHDLYFAQGYITARFRLWQMDIETRAAAGRISEVLGPGAIEFDRSQRRKGMVVAAENALKGLEANPVTKDESDAYTAGVNAYISSLNQHTLPLEYKLLDYQPEKWNNLKCALLLKYMADQLTGGVDDLEYSNAMKIFSTADLHLMFPDFPDTLDPVIPIGTAFPKPTIHAVIPLFQLKLARKIAGIPEDVQKPNPENGSNNWAVSGEKTKSGAPILCNDPHLDLNLPSLWFEAQLHTPEMNVYGATLPGEPGVIIGFNNFLAWGVTNAQRDVKDFYSIRFKNASKNEYWFNHAWKKSKKRIEIIHVRGGKTILDTVAYTFFGPVMYDQSFPDTVSLHPFLAERWTALDSSNDFLAFNLLNHARNYADYKEAIQYFQCPGQNFVYADKTGNIAIREQGKFPLEWKDQGKYILPGLDSTFMWQGFIPMKENPHILNPARQFVSSANQNPTDTTYPYYYHGDFKYFRGHRINTRLQLMNHIRIRDMMKLQTDNYNSLAAEALPLMFHFLNPKLVDQKDQIFLSRLKKWDFLNNPQSYCATYFTLWWDQLYKNIWDDEMSRSSLPLPWPGNGTTIQWLLRDSTMKFIDNIYTQKLETLSDQVSSSFIVAAKEARNLQKQHLLEWGKYQGTDILHLTRLPALSRMRLFTGGGADIINATEKKHGPSWRMIVELTTKIKAFGIYPGGQSGNPGSFYYDNMINDWVAGNYYPLHFFSRNDLSDPAIKFKILFLNN
ncbi:MAG: penicillin acylase family protein [Chitinophagaceae bacterium]